MIKNKKIVLSACVLVILLVFALTGILVISSGNASAETMSVNSDKAQVVVSDPYNQTFLFPYATDKVAYFSYTQGSESYAENSSSWPYYNNTGGSTYVERSTSTWKDITVKDKYNTFNIPSVLNGDYTNLVITVNLYRYILNYYQQNVGGEYPYLYGYFSLWTASSGEVYNVKVYHTGEVTSNNVKIQITYLKDNSTYDLYYSTGDQRYNCFYFSNCLPATDYTQLTYRYPDTAPDGAFWYSSSNLPSATMRTQFMSLMTHNEAIQVNESDTMDTFSSAYLFGYLSSFLGEGFIYDAAYEAGYNSAIEDNQTQYNLGYENGYQIALANQGKYTFTGLLGAVVKAPITALIGEYNSDTGKREGGLLTFELLGYDMSNFFMSLVSVCVIIAVIRLFI